MEKKQVCIRTMDGRPQRQVFTAFEICALQSCVEMGVENGGEFTHGNDGEKFAVIKNADGVVAIRREKTGQTLMAKYVIKGGDEMPQEMPDRNRAMELPQELQQVEEQQKTVKKDMERQVKETGAQNAAAVVENLRALLGGAAVDENQVKAICAALIDEKTGQFAAALERIEKQTPIVKQFVINDLPPVEVKGIVHDEFEDVLKWVNNKKNVYLLGGAGTGKSTLAKNVADVLGLEFCAASALQDKSELTGYCDINGKFVETTFYKMFTNGGLFLLDEIDATSGEVLVAFNNAIANRIFEFPGVGMKKAHENFRCIAAANTSGQGRTNKYSGRFKIDASTLDRFVFIDVDYCKEIEMQMCNGDEQLYLFVKTCRESIDKLGLTYTATPRACERIATGLMFGFTLEKAIKQGLCGGWDKTDRKMILENVRQNLSDNKYLDAFGRI